ncbi:MAG: hypothetical protein HY657_05775 [Acidobacteria bacterium]|nr:hypothetical protein [Acidobacteriota bacterium]
MAQPALGLVASAIVIAISLIFVSLFDFPTFVGWVSFYNLCLIPFQVVAVVLWAGANPPFVAKLPQPAKGLVMLLVTAAAAAVIAPIALNLAGEGVSPPGPIPSHFVIVVVPTTFYLAIMWGGWPFTKLFKNPVVAGLALLVFSYAFTYAFFRIFHNYDFMQGAPVYLASAPQGMFNGVMTLVFWVTALAVMFLILCFDLWPFTRAPGLMQQPVLGLVWTLAILVIGAILVQVGVTAMGNDPMIFFTRTTVPFIFGSIIVLNMLQGSLFAKMTQPLKGVANAVAALVVGVLLANLYGVLAPTVTGQLASGPPGYDYEVWLANALLSVTFPFLIFYAVYLNYWPLVKPAAVPETAAAGRR